MAPKPEDLTRARRRALLSQLTTLERDVLDELCQTRSTRNAVVLAIDLVNRRRLLRFGDQYGLVAEVLEKLNELDLVRYYEGDHGVPIDIRVTTLGYHAAGYSLAMHEVNAQSIWNTKRLPDDASIRHPGDKTDFRTQNYRTFGGPIERLPLPEHLEKYPDHVPIHPTILELAEALGHSVRPVAVPREDTPMAIMIKGVKTPPEILDRIAAMLRAGRPNAEIVESTGIKDKAIIARVGREIGVIRGPRGKIITLEEANRLKAKQAAAIGKVDEATKTEMDRQAREMRATGFVDADELSRRFGVSAQTAREYLKERGWKVVGPTGHGRLTPPEEGVVTSTAPTNGAEPHAEIPVSAEPTFQTTKIGMLKAMTRMPQPIPNIGELASRLRTSLAAPKLNEHDIAKNLYDLQKQGYVSMVAGQHLGAKRIKSIRVTSRGQAWIRQLESPSSVTRQNERPEPKPVTPTKPDVEERHDEAVIEATPPAPTRKVDSAGYPVLAGLLARARVKAEAASKRDALLAAAALLENLDPEESERLLARATAGEGEPFSPVEAEYLEFAKAHGV